MVCWFEFLWFEVSLGFVGWFDIFIATILCYTLLVSISFSWCDPFQFILLVSRGALVPVAMASPAPVSTVGKLRLVVVAVQGAPKMLVSGTCDGEGLCR